MSVEEAAAIATALANIRWSRATPQDRKAEGARLAEARKAARRRAGKRRIKKTQPSTTE